LDGTRSKGVLDPHTVNDGAIVEVLGEDACTSGACRGGDYEGVPVRQRVHRLQLHCPSDRVGVDPLHYGPAESHDDLAGVSSRQQFFARAGCHDVELAQDLGADDEFVRAEIGQHSYCSVVFRLVGSVVGIDQHICVDKLARESCCTALVPT
jgi:hypothetical protein